MKKILTKKPFFLTVSLLSLFAVILRFLLLGKGIDPVTGFYYERFGTMRLIFIAVFVIAMFFGIFWLRYVRKKAIMPLNMKFDLSPFLSERLLFALLTVGFAVNTFFEIYRLIKPSDSITMPGMVTAFGIITTLLSAASLLYFISLSFLNNSDSSAAPFLCIIPILWAVFRIMRDFISFSTIYFISENLLDIVYICCLVLCLLACGRMIADSDFEKGFRIFTVMAPITIVFGFALSIPAIIGFICNFYTLSGSDMFMHFADLTLSLFFLRLAMHLYKEN